MKRNIIAILTVLLVVSMPSLVQAKSKKVEPFRQATAKPVDYNARLLQRGILVYNINSVPVDNLMLKEISDIMDFVNAHNLFIVLRPEPAFDCGTVAAQGCYHEFEGRIELSTTASYFDYRLFYEFSHTIRPAIGDGYDKGNINNPSALYSKKEFEAYEKPSLIPYFETWWNSF